MERTDGGGRAKVEIAMPFGDSELHFTLPPDRLAGVLKATSGGTSVTPEDERAEIRRALAEPIGAPPLHELSASASSAAIVVSDVTRPCPSQKFLPALLEELRPIPPERMTIIFALGGHRGHSREEQEALVGEKVAASGVRLLDLDREDCVPFGTTRRGTPLAFFRAYCEADLRVCTGNIDYHYFAGFSGGAKAVLPGVSSDETIRANHRMMLESQARAGILEGNPVREDIDEAGGIVGIDFLCNVVLDEEHRILRAVAGDYLAAHRAGVAFCDAHCALRVREAADIVVASPGGAPKDMNLYQAHKTLDNVVGAVRDGGVIVLVARCQEGLGNEVFGRWMTEAEGLDDLARRIRGEFVLGGHKAAAIGSLLKRVRVFLISEMPDNLVRAVHMTPFAEVESAVSAALGRCGDGARVLVVPHGNRVTARVSGGAKV